MSQAYCTGASLLVRIISAAINFVIFPEDGLEVVSIDLSPADNNARWAHGGGYATFAGKIIEANGYHGDTVINHDLWNLSER